MGSKLLSTHVLLIGSASDVDWLMTICTTLVRVVVVVVLVVVGVVVNSFPTEYNNTIQCVSVT